jgi:hypothetical protein
MDTTGDETKIGSFVETKKNASIGCNVKFHLIHLSARGIIDDEVFIGHGVMFTNDLFPRSTTMDGSFQTEADWELVDTHKRASIEATQPFSQAWSLGKMPWWEQELL